MSCAQSHSFLKTRVPLWLQNSPRPSHDRGRSSEKNPETSEEKSENGDAFDASVLASLHIRWFTREKRRFCILRFVPLESQSPFCPVLLSYLLLIARTSVHLLCGKLSLRQGRNFSRCWRDKIKTSLATVRLIKQLSGSEWSKHYTWIFLFSS